MYKVLSLLCVLCVVFCLAELCKGQGYSGGLTKPRPRPRPRPCSIPRCRMACPYGYVNGPDGCASCTCKPGPRPRPCSTPLCRIACQYGYVKGPDGCAICQCKPGPRPRPCSTPRCRIACPNGYVTGPNGCATCRCKPGVFPPGPPTGPDPRLQCPVGASSLGKTCPSGMVVGQPIDPNACGPHGFCHPSPFDGPGLCCDRRIIEPIPVPRPGRCPPNNVFTTCVVKQDHCSFDQECPRGRKCCPYGCGRQCLRVRSRGKY